MGEHKSKCDSQLLGTRVLAGSICLVYHEYQVTLYGWQLRLWCSIRGGRLCLDVSNPALFFWDGLQRVQLTEAQSLDNLPCLRKPPNPQISKDDKTVKRNREGGSNSTSSTDFVDFGDVENTLLNTIWSLRVVGERDTSL